MASRARLVRSMCCCYQQVLGQNLQSGLHAYLHSVLVFGLVGGVCHLHGLCQSYAGSVQAPNLLHNGCCLRTTLRPVSYILASAETLFCHITSALVAVVQGAVYTDNVPGRQLASLRARQLDFESSCCTAVTPEGRLSHDSPCCTVAVMRPSLYRLCQSACR